MDIPLEDGQRVNFGSYSLQAIATPGHTNSCLSFYLEASAENHGLLFTGDALLIRGCGRTDFQNGSSDLLYESVVEKFFTLPGATRIYPAHDYNGHTSSTIAIEKALDPRLGGGRTKSEFIKLMSELKLAMPSKISQALPANLSCGK